MLHVFLCLLIILKWNLENFYDGSKHNESRTVCNSCRLTQLERKISTSTSALETEIIFNLLSLTAETKDNHFHLHTLIRLLNWDLSCKRTQFGILVQLKSKYIWSILIYVEGFHASWTFLVLQQQQNLGRRFGTSKMHLRPLVA